MVNHPNRSKRKKLTSKIEHNHDQDYAAFLAGVRVNFPKQPLFQTNTAGLWDIYLDNLPADRQIHSCTACRKFVDHFGGLAVIAENGVHSSAIWNPDAVPEFYREAVLAMRQAVGKARVTAPYLSSETTWGIPTTGPWTHLSVQSPSSVFRRTLLTANQAMAAKREDFRTVATALADFTPDMLNEALRLLEASALPSSEKFVAPVKWLLDLHTRRAASRNARIKDNLLWKAIASAPDGYCHPRASVVGALLEDIAAALPFEDIKARFSAKVHPLQYQRPQAAPTRGNIEQAEKLVEQMEIAPSLARRFARLDEIETIWKPTEAAKPQSGGVFAHLKAKGAVKPVDLPATTMTWAKFAKMILPTAEVIEILVPHGNANFTAMLTAENLDAPPILKWDYEEARNPVSAYVYHGGSPAHQWGVTAGAWCAVTAIAERSNNWGDKPQPHHGEGITLVLEGCVDSRSGQGNALFPETLRTELHSIRSTIEAYSRNAEIGGREQASAGGLMVPTKGAINYRLRVTAGGYATEYLIDRWD